MLEENEPRFQGSDDDEFETVNSESEKSTDELIEELENASNFMRGVMLDPRLPVDIKSALMRKVIEVDTITEDYNS